MRNRPGNNVYNAPLSKFLRGKVLVGWFSLGALNLSSSAAWSQFGNDQQQPYTPAVVGGLPPGSKGLEQPVYIANRDVSKFEPASDALDLSEYVGQNVGAPTQTPRYNLKEFSAGGIVAVVGEEPILLGHLYDPKKLTPDIAQSTAFEREIRGTLVRAILRKSLSQRFIDEQVPGKGLKEREAAQHKIKAAIVKAFYNDALPGMMKQAKCDSEQQFYEQLAKAGKTIQTLQAEWGESVLADQCVKAHIDNKPNISLSEMEDYYDEHQEDFRQTAKAKFEILTADFSKYPSREAALQAIKEMFDQVFYGNPFPNVAKQKSTGWHASQSGQMDWTSKNSLRSKPINEALFSIDLNKLSDIIEDADGYHIIRVQDRREEAILSFTEAQSEIKQILIKKRKKDQEKEYLDKVKAETAVWTRWPEDYPGSMPLNQVY